MSHSLQCHADVQPLTSTLRKLLLTFEQSPPRRSKLDAAFNDFLAAFGDAKESELPVLISDSTALNGSVKLALHEALSSINKAATSAVIWQDNETTIAEYEAFVTRFDPDPIRIHDARKKIEHAITLIAPHSATQVAQTAPVGGTILDKPEDTEYGKAPTKEQKERQENMLITLFELSATSHSTRKTQSEIVSAFHRDHDPANYKRTFADLKSMGLIESVDGRGGGVWLSLEGISAAKRISEQSNQTTNKSGTKR